MEQTQNKLQFQRITNSKKIEKEMKEKIIVTHIG